MLRISFLIAAVIAIVALALRGEPAQAQTPSQALETAGPSDSARYTYYRARDNFIRLDVETGQVSECGWTASGWFCRVVPDERMALETEIYRLQHDNVALKKALLERGLPLPDGIKADVPVRRSMDGRRRWPGAGEFDRVTSAMGDLWRRMVHMMANLQRDMLRRT